ncbi:MAG: radical SAM protein [Prevotella sp.]|nr:radical SAM protein [Prevotella sp.]MBQ6209998.1 radical SAM protein [Prevotella sp.]
MKQLNVLFVIPCYETYGMSGHYVMPMGILYVSAYVKQSGVCMVHTLNLNHIEGDEYQVLRDYCIIHDIHVIGVGGLSGEYKDLARIVGYARKINPKIFIVVGGGIMTAAPKVAMRAFENADCGIIGEGELTTVELLQTLTNGGSLASVRGIIYRDGGMLRKTLPRAEIMELDSLPFPDYEGFNYKEYLEQNPDLSDDGKQYTPISVIGGRSCKYNCTFCFHPSGTKYRQRSLDSIFSEIDYLIAHYKVSYIALREELFATDNKRVYDFCQRINKYDVDWSIQLRIDSINQDLVDILKNTRCRYVFVGVESADDMILKSMKKGVKRNQIEHALEMLKNAGLNSRSGVIFGDTEETYESAQYTLKWFYENRKQYRLYVDMIIAFPGTDLYERACKNNVIPDPVQFLKDGCPIVNISKMTNEEFRQLVKDVECINYRKYNVKNYPQ